ncbi:MAG: phenylacetate--CoA ligase family protein, partial [Candidatus Bathyarchaeota archaeon]|nr:phenylacetate--CoA ligase family protein [Candidatus Bathyarchaeota archaeon]
MWLRKIFNLYELRKNQWLKPSELQRIQGKKLRAIIKHAYSTVEFYHKKFNAAGIKPDDIRTIEDLPKIPVTTKSEIRNGVRTEKILSKNRNPSKCHFERTGGSAGEPLDVIYDEKAVDFQKAVAVRSFLEIGVGFRDKWVVITTPQRTRMQKQWFQILRILSPTYLSVFDPVEHQVSVIKKLNPKVIAAYTSSLWLLAKAMREKRIDSIRPEVVYTSAEVLTDETRKFINDTFDLEIFDMFGCAEVGRSAWECAEHVGYHMDVDALAMEFVKDNEHVASGEMGRLLYTSLYNYAMPLIRYDVGDMCVPTDELCPCGRGLPLIKHIEGRRDDLVVTPEGRILSPHIFGIIMREIPGIVQYRIIQE